MRNLQPRLVDDCVAVQQQVEIDRPRTPPLTTHPSERPLDPEQRREELARGECRLDYRRSVQESRLIDDTDRIRLE